LVEDSIGRWTISAIVYLSPNFTVKQEHLEEFYNTLRQQFIAGGDYNAKHTVWGSRLTTPRGCGVLKIMEKRTTYTPLHRWTYILAVRLEQIIGPSWFLCHRRYHAKFCNSQIMLWSHQTTPQSNKCKTRETAVLKQQIYKLRSLLSRQWKTTSKNPTESRRKHWSSS
jgi:hypothetical protein